MRKPWQIWLAFVLSLAIVIPAMAGLTLVALRLDHEQATAKQRAELEEIIANLLWQMDSDVTRWLAPETARPTVAYQPFQSQLDATQPVTARLSLPLLIRPPEMVLIHFQADVDGTWISPECPDESEWSALAQFGIPASWLREKQARLSELKTLVSSNELLTHVPEVPPMSMQSEAGGELTFLRNDALPAQQMATPQSAMGMSGMMAGMGGMSANAQNAQGMQTPGSEGVGFGGGGSAYAPREPFYQQTGSTVAPRGPEKPGGQADSRSGERFADEVSRTQQSYRGGKGLMDRNRTVQEATQQQAIQQRMVYNESPVGPSVVLDNAVEGPAQIFWFKDQLLLARRVIIGRQTFVQGCWLNWKLLNERLTSQAQEVLSSASIHPVPPGVRAEPNRILAAIPARLKVPNPVVITPTFSAIRISLLTAWLLLMLAAGAVAVLLHGVVRLSERRAAFVSAVTHELRTPLTTFRLYSEMLAENMVSDQTQRMTYVDTLRQEAERLSHLVENVLQYARLERSKAPPATQVIRVEQMIARIAPALERRVERSRMKLLLDADEPVRALALRADCGVVEQILFNLVDNACKYAAQAEDRRIHWTWRLTGSQIEIEVRDHGPGIAPQQAKRLFQPFSKTAQEAAHSAPGVGLGLALSKRLAREIGGRLDWHRRDDGAVFVLTLRV